SAVEDGLLPHDRATRDGSPDEIEEERRLLFVGATRAKQRLFLTRASFRTMHGKDYPSPPSRFLQEMQLSFGRSLAPQSSDDWAALSEAENDPGLADAPDPSAAEQVAAADKLTSPRAAKRRRSGLPVLTTAADLLNGTSRPVELPLAFTVGMMVRHPQLG